jgi:CubicO group peptidase (beta-lactamase class C family)
MVRRLIQISLIIFFIIFDLAFGFSRKVDFNEPIPRPNNHQLAPEISFDPKIYSGFERHIERFVQQWGITGASIAVAKDNQLVYAKGFGFANRENEEPMQPDNLLRVASVSKLISAVAIMKLVEGGRLKLESSVFGKDGILNDTIFNGYIDKRVEDIKILHLLNHSAGWTTNWGDHLFMQEKIARQLNKELPISQDDIIAFALAKRLHFQPGARSSYNNLGYLVLEKVIERVVGIPYEDYVRNYIFKPIGIYDAYIANNYDSLRYHKEVRYYEVPEAEPVPAFDGKPKMVLKSRGGNDIRSLGAAGGWVISSVSLVKFLIAIDSENDNGLISKKSAIKLMESEPGFHPLGWRWIAMDGTKWRTGSFAGTSALAISRSDGFTYVFVTNTSPWVGARFPYEVNKMMTRAIQSVEEWPNINLFNSFARLYTYVEREVYPNVNRGWDPHWEFCNIIISN